MDDKTEYSMFRANALRRQLVEALYYLPTKAFR